MEVLSQIHFTGTKFYHRRNIKIELVEDNKKWRVMVVSDEQAQPVEKIVYDGDDKWEAEYAYMTGVHYHFADDYRLNPANVHEKEKIFEMFHKIVESLYMKMLANLGYGVTGKWDMRSFLKSKDDKQMDEIILVMRRMHKTKIPKRF